LEQDLFPSHHPLTPPHTVEDQLDWLRLLRSRRVGVSTFFRLMAEHGNAKAALAALPGIAAAAGVKNYAYCPEQVARAELKAGRIAGATLIAFGAPDYPKALAEIPDPPPLLWARGDIAMLNRPAIAIAGARNASSLGMRTARKIAVDLGAAGYVIVSGLARGIDTAAHQAGLPTGTIAVVAGGVDVVYPAENATLTQEIEDQGCIVSEQPMGMRPTNRHFPRRNRIISGLSAGVVVVEAAAKSGSLITAREALDQGREVFAVPGHPFDARTGGCNMLIRDGATLVRGARDVTDVLPGRSEPDPVAVDEPGGQGTRTWRDQAALHTEILGRLGPSPLAEDQLIRDVGGGAAEISPALVELELTGKIQRQPGGLLSLA